MVTGAPGWRRSPLRGEVTSISAVTAAVPSGAIVVVPLTVSNLLCTLLTIRGRTEKSIEEWTGSIAHVPTPIGLVTTAVVILGLSNLVRVSHRDLRGFNRTSVGFISFVSRAFGVFPGGHTKDSGIQAIQRGAARSICTYTRAGVNVSWLQ